MILRKFTQGFTLATALIASIAIAAPAAKPVTVGIVVPIAIPAMNQIVSGFTSELTKLYPGNIKFLIKNAQGNINIQRSIIQEYKAQGVNMIVPIGTSTTEMTLAMLQSTKIPTISLAAEITKADRASMHNKNMTNILDQIAISKQINFIHAAMPQLKMMTLVYSPSPTVAPEIKQVNDGAGKYGIKVQKFMMQELPDLYTISKHINPKSQAIFILKDEVVVSGINTLLQQAIKMHIPVIASDDGSVAKGAAFAVGVSETQIGTGGAKLALQVLHGTPASQVPLKFITHYSVFVNMTGIKKQGVNFANVQKAAKQLGYPIVDLN